MFKNKRIRNYVIALAPVLLVVLVMFQITNNAKVDKAVVYQEAKTNQEEVTNKAMVDKSTINESKQKDINQFVKKYYKDPQKVKNDYNSGIEYYNNINTYVKAGLNNTDYIVYVTYKMKYENIDTLAPGMSVLQVVEKDGEFLVDNETDEALVFYVEKLSQEEDIKKIIEKVNSDLSEAMKKDNSLQTFINKLKEKAK